MSPELAAAIGTALGTPLRDAVAAGGGFSWNWRALAGDRPVFIKVCPDGDRLAAEADGLAALAAADGFRIPAVLACGVAGRHAFLVLEWLPLESGGDDRALADALARLHNCGGPRFGWRRDNFIGATPQENAPSDDWAQFFAQRRLAPQLRLAAAQGHGCVTAPGSQLLTRLPELLAGHTPFPALLHGDLWRGNVGFVAGQPCVYDPAVHYGDRECDLAMADLFGGFSPAFFTAYCKASPLPSGWQERRRLYQLYHLLNHLNLFGRGYLPQVMDILGTYR